MTADQDATQQDPQPPAPEPGLQYGGGERIMGVIMVALCIVGIGIGLDLATGGAVVPALARVFAPRDDEGG